MFNEAAAPVTVFINKFTLIFFIIILQLLSCTYEFDMLLRGYMGLGAFQSRVFFSILLNSTKCLEYYPKFFWSRSE